MAEKVLYVRLDPELKKKAEQAARSEDRNVSQWIREVIRERLSLPKKALARR